MIAQSIFAKIEKAFLGTPSLSMYVTYFTAKYVANEAES
jgi:hypothetical protein